MAASLIGKDRGATEGKPVYVRPPVERQELYSDWLKSLPSADRSYYEVFKDIVFRLDGDLYGRRTAGSVYRDELEQILVERLPADKFRFKRGVKDPCIYRCEVSGVILIHHVDDIRACGPTDALRGADGAATPHPL